MCKRCQSRASLPLDAIGRPRDTPIWNWKRRAEMQIMPHTTLFATCSSD
jgi:hypothetical protein